MPVTYRTFNAGADGGGGSNIVLQTLWTDDFNRADTIRGLGNDYTVNYFVSNSSANDNPFPRIFGNALQWENATVASQVPGCHLIPWKIFNTAVYGKSQFAQLTWVSTNIAGSADFFSLMVTGAGITQDMKFYFYGLAGAALLRILSCTFTAGVLVPTSIGTCAVAAGDVIRGEVVPGVATNRVAAIINGVKLIDVVDATAGLPIQTGMPALSGFNLSNGTAAIMDNFSCGLGTTFIS